MQLCPSKLIREFENMEKQAIPMWDNTFEKAGKKLWKSPREVLMLCVSCVKKNF